MITIALGIVLGVVFLFLLIAGFGVMEQGDGPGCLIWVILLIGACFLFFR